MSLRTAGAVTILLIGLGTGPVLAQFLPPPPPLLPPPFMPPPFRQLPPVDVEDDAAPPYDPPPGYRRMPPPGTYAAPPGNYQRGADPGYVPPGPQYGRGPPPQDADYPPGGWREPPPLPGNEPVDPRDRGPTYGNQPYGNQPYGNQPYGNAPVYGNNQPDNQPPPYDDQRRSNQGVLPIPTPLDILRPPGAVGREQVGRDQESVVASLPPDVRPETGPRKELPPQFQRTTVDYRTREPAGTLIVDTSNTYLYLVLGNGKAMRYGIGVGREGFTWTGAEKVSRMAEWPDWHPPAEMIERQPYLPRFMAGGEGNPLGARALYLGKTLYRIHGTNQPSTIGTFVSSGCIRLTNEDITDLYYRVQVGTRVVVLPGRPPASANAAPMGNEPQQPYNPLAPRR